MFENLRRGRQERNFTTNLPKILDVKSSSEQILSENCRWVPLKKALVSASAIVKTINVFRQNDFVIFIFNHGALYIHRSFKRKKTTL